MDLGKKKKKELERCFALALVGDAFSMFSCVNGGGVGVVRHSTCSARRCCRPLWVTGQELNRVVCGRLCLRAVGNGRGEARFLNKLENAALGGVPDELGSAAHRCHSWNRRK